MKRVLLKLSGEALAGDKKTGFDEATCIGVAKQVKQIVDQGIQVAIVTGGGNFWRGRTSETIDRTKADQIGMLATVMNCIYVSDIFRHVGMKTEVFTPFVCGAFTSLFSKDAAVEALKNGEEDVEEMREAYSQRRRYLMHAFKEMGLACFEPYGAFYVFPSIKEFGMTSDEFATRLLQEEKVAVVPGTAFGDCGEGYLRISYAYSLENLKVALGRLSHFIQRLRAEKGNQ